MAHADQRFRRVLRVRVKLVCVERLVAKEVEAGAVKVAGAAARRDGDRGAAVSSFFGGGVVSGDLEFLYVVRIDSVKIRNRIRHARLVRFDAVDRDVVSAITRAVDVYA